MEPYQGVACRARGRAVRLASAPDLGALGEAPRRASGSRFLSSGSSKAI